MSRSDSNETQEPPAALVIRLTAALDDLDVKYCHWKSNEAIKRSETAENDLDLLVAREDSEKFRQALHQTGFKRLERGGRPRPPGKEDFYGYDEGTGRFVHVDAHYQLVLGHDRTKNHRIPIEDAYLESAKHCGLFKIPTPEFEYVIFVIRMVLKYAVWDEIVWETMRGRKLGPKKSERRELVQLESAVDFEILTNILENHLPWLNQVLFSDCVAVAKHEVTLRRRLAIGRRLHNEIEAFARQGPLADSALRVWRRFMLGIKYRFGRKPRFKMPEGGALIGVMGGDGAGKSTALEEMTNWLENDFELRRIHLGKPPWSATTYAVRGALKVANKAVSAVSKETKSISTYALVPDSDYRSLAWLACTSRDRYLTYRKARRFANRGGIVLSDRYPHRGMTSMDVAQIAQRVDGQKSNRIVDALIHMEERYHDRIATPELLVILLVDPETAAIRKTDEPSDYVRRRVAEVYNVDWEALSVHVIDAAQPKEAVAQQLKSLIWRKL